MKLSDLKCIPIIVSFVMLAGCTGMNSNFGCNAKASTTCTPVSQVNARADLGAFDNEEQGIRRIRLPTRASVAPHLLGDPVRTNERIQHIWIAPYQDLDHNYHEASDVYTVLEQPHWMGNPEKEIKTTETEQED